MTRLRSGKGLGCLKSLGTSSQWAVKEPREGNFIQLKPDVGLQEVDYLLEVRACFVAHACKVAPFAWAFNLGASRNKRPRRSGVVQAKTNCRRLHDGFLEVLRRPESNLLAGLDLDGFAGCQLLLRVGPVLRARSATIGREDEPQKPAPLRGVLAKRHRCVMHLRLIAMRS